jgi:hypothetical protein
MELGLLSLNPSSQENFKEHWGDLDCEELGDFRTFYMTCICGWKSELKMINSSVDSYQFQEKWRQHREPKSGFRRHLI